MTFYVKITFFNKILLTKSYLIFQLNIVDRVVQSHTHINTLKLGLHVFGNVYGRVMRSGDYL